MLKIESADNHGSSLLEDGRRDVNEIRTTNDVLAKLIPALITIADEFARMSKTLDDPPPAT